MMDRNETTLAAALEPVYAALLRAVRPDVPPPPPSDPDSSVAALADLFALTPFERDTLLLCAGVELEARFAAACAAAHGDPALTTPSFGLALTTLANPHWSALGRNGSLRYWRLIELLPGAGLTRSTLRIDPRILEALLGLETNDERLDGIARRLANPALPTFLEPAADSLLQALAGQRAISEPARARLAGGTPAQRRDVAAAAFSRAGLAAHAIDLGQIPHAAAERALLARIWNREARLTASGLYLETAAADVAGLLVAFAGEVDGPLIVEDGEAAAHGLAAIRVELPAPEPAERRQAWLQGLGTEHARLNGALESLAAQFPAEPDTIAAARLALRRQPGDATQHDLHRAAWIACREQSRRGLEQLATRIEPRAEWDDLVLPAPQKNTLRQIATHLRGRAVVHEQWGFAGKYTRGLGLTALFAGASGVGKTMAAEVIAHTLELDLFQIDLAATVSKYIGETEKNLKRIFEAAEQSGAILLFDEADALFGKRSEVKDSHDRYANMEISYLLQRMEAYRGLAVLTTNMRHAMDAAFLRRLRFVVEFSLPDAAQRHHIWARVFPRQTPTEALDCAALARLNVAGGTIRNIALHAAHLAAADASPVRMPHLMAAARIEYAKLERPLTSTETEGWA